MPSPSACTAVCAAMVFMAAGQAAGQVAQQAPLPLDPASLPVLPVPGPRGEERMRLADGSARTSAAWVEAADGTLEPGYQVTADVIVRLDGVVAGGGAGPGGAAEESLARIAAMLRAKFGAAGPEWRWAVIERATEKGREGLPGFFVLRASSVARAAEAARFLASRPVAGAAAWSPIEAYVNTVRPIADRLPTDPGFPQQWHLYSSEEPSSDINADAAWNDGYTGAGVTVGVLEAGWYLPHPDLAAKHNPAASQPDLGFSSHGTSVAGLIGAQAGNGLGGVGVAYDALLSRQYYFGGSVGIAQAFGFRNDLNAVKSNSWGPSDNGRLSFISSAESAALDDAALNGRGGKGTIFIWAGGNGAAVSDRVDYDAYASHRRVIAVGAIDALDRRSVYSEPGSALMVCAPSDYDLFSSADLGIYTTDGQSTYTSNFGGTSAAAPIAAGAVALMLQANPALTWRDVQHVLIESARRCDPTSPGWRSNAAGYAHHYDYGFGAVDAGAASALASAWSNVPAEQTGSAWSGALNIPIPDNAPMNLGGGVTATMPVSANLRIERVQLVLSAPHPWVGNLRVELESPWGTRSLFAGPRTDSTAGAYNGYIFTSVRYWGERGAGVWTLRISDEAAGNTGLLTGWELRVFGTAPACSCDWDHSGVLDADDLFAFLNSWFAGAGDYDASGSSDADDIFGFLQCWFTLGIGCGP